MVNIGPVGGGASTSFAPRKLEQLATRPRKDALEEKARASVAARQEGLSAARPKGRRFRCLMLGHTALAEIASRACTAHGRAAGADAGD
jgi:hypothetical protein